MLIKCPECNFVTKIDEEENPRFECEECETKLKVPGTPSLKSRGKKRVRPADNTVRNLVGGGALLVIVVVGIVVWGTQLGWFKSDKKPVAAAGKVDPDNRWKKESDEYELASRDAIKLTPFPGDKGKVGSSAEEVAFELSDLKKAGTQHDNDYYTLNCKILDDKYKSAAKLLLVCQVGNEIYEKQFSPSEIKTELQKVFIESFFFHSNTSKKMTIWIENPSEFRDKTRGTKLSKPIALER